MLVGIDPGEKGGVCAYSKEKKHLIVGKMPPTIGGKTSFFKKVSSFNEKEHTVVIEKLTGVSGVRRGIGGNIIGMSNPASSGKLMRNVGEMYALAYVGGFNIIEVPPQTWMKKVGASVGASMFSKDRTRWKNHLKQIAEQNFPSVRVTLAISDALLIMLSQKNEPFEIEIIEYLKNE